MSEMNLEEPADDALEQHQDALGDEDGAGGEAGNPGDGELTAGEQATGHRVPLDADEADTADQERAIGYDDDDYR